MYGRFGHEPDNVMNDNSCARHFRAVMEERERPSAQGTIER